MYCQRFWKNISWSDTIDLKEFGMTKFRKLRNFCNSTHLSHLGVVSFQCCTFSKAIVLVVSFFNRGTSLTDLITYCSIFHLWDLDIVRIYLVFYRYFWDRHTQHMSYFHHIHRNRPNQMLDSNQLHQPHNIHI